MFHPHSLWLGRPASSLAAQIRATNVASGSQRITLVETHSIRASALSGSRAAATVFVAPMVFERAGQQQMHSVSWVAGDGTSLVLSGALSVAELEALKNQVVR